MRYHQILLASGAALLPATAASAADQLKFGAAPPWVVEQAIPPASDKVKDKPVALLLHDQQVLLEPGKISTFAELAFKIQKPEGLAAGNLSIAWNPAFDTPTVNRLEIRRGSQVIDVLNSGQTFTTMRRESNLEVAMLDGMLTANIQPEGLQEGDVVVLATTTEHSDPTLKGHVETNFAPWGEAQIGLAHARIIWPSNRDLRFLKTGDLPAPQQSVRDGRKIYEVTMRDVDPVIDPKGAPVRFKIGRLGQATDFRSWAEAGRLMAPLYREAAAIPASGPLRDEVEKIRKASADPKVRAEQALQLVQQRIRYVALLMGQGGYVPAPAETTWSRRFGDCKAKTALLLAILHELGIQAEPVAANPILGDAIGEQLPMIGMFNHVLVRAHIASKDYWLDGTRTGDTSLDSIEVPDYGWALPLVENAALVHMMPAPLAVPKVERKVNIDASAGVFAPAPVTIEQINRGDSAVELNTLYSALSTEQRDEQMRDTARGYFTDVTVASSSLAFDKGKRELHLTIKGSAKLSWKDGWLYVPTSSIAFSPDFERPAGPLHDVPWAVNHPSFAKDQATVRLPPGFAAQQKLESPVHETLAGIEYARSETLSGDVLTVDSSERSVAAEVPYKDALAAAPRLNTLDRQDVYLSIPKTYLPTSQDLAALTSQQPQTAMDYFWRAVAYFAHQKIDEAIADLNSGLALDPKNVWALLKRSGAYIRNHQFAEAEKDLQAANAIAPADSNVLAEWGELTQNKGDYGAALSYYSKALENDPGNNWARLRRAGVMARLGKRDQALGELGTVLTADPRNSQALAERAQILAFKEDWPGAENDISAALAINPNESTALATKAMVAVWRKDYKGALELAAETLKRDPSNSYARNLQAQLLKRAGNTMDAMHLLDEAVARAPKDASPLLDRAYAHYEAKDYDAAEKDIAAALQVAPNDARGLAARAQVQTARGDFAGAIQSLTAVLKASPSNGLLLAQRAEAYRQIREYELAFADTEAALKTGLISPELRLLRLNILLAKGDLAAVSAETDLLVKENPTSDFALVIAGKTYTQLGLTAKAMESFDRAIAIKPYSYIYINRAEARPFSDIAGKLRDYDEALKLEPEQENALAEKAELLSRQGKHSESIDLYDRAIKTSLDSSYLILGRAVLLQRAGRSDEAGKVFATERAKAKTAADFNRLCWTKATRDVLLQSALEDCREATRLDPNYPTVDDSLGLVLLKLGKLDDARTAYTRAIAKKSGPDAYLGRAIVFARMGDLVRAQSDAAQARKLRPNIDDQFAEYGLKLDDKPGSTTAAATKAAAAAKN